MRSRVALGARELEVDLAQPVSLALSLEFGGAQPRHFGAPPASAHPYAVPGFAGAVEAGASCNCEVLTLIPHCNGTHTECVGHLTREALDAHRVIPAGFVPALLVSVTPEPAKGSAEDSVPPPQPGDLLVTRRALEAAWGAAPFAPEALAIRTRPNSLDKRSRDYSEVVPPYLSRQAAELLVDRGIWHLIVDLPSVDRTHDEGRLTAHRIFFGLPADSVQLRDAKRASATITELAFMPEEAADGAYLAQLQAPAHTMDFE